MSLGLLDFDELEARFQCEDIQPGYIFLEEQQESRLCQSCRDARGRSLLCPGEPSVCRIFFKDDTGALYLVDVGGRSNMSKALNKVHKMNDALVKGRFA